MSFVFLSHRSVDKPRIRHFVLRLIDRKVPVWIDNYAEFNAGLPDHEPRIEARMLAGGLGLGSEWPAEIDKALLRASAIVVFWSNAWSSARSVLNKEYGIALARHRAGAATYLPVFLDDPQTLSADLRRYRDEMGDVIQGFDVARLGHEHWTALVEAVAAACGRTAGGIGATAKTGERIDWEAALQTSRRASEDVDLLRAMPEGPAVDSFRVYHLKRRFALGTDFTSAPMVVAQAAHSVLEALGRRPDNSYAYVLSPMDLGEPANKGLLTYWSRTFDQACMLGPRMVAALILAAPPAVVHGFEHELGLLLKTLEEMP